MAVLGHFTHEEVKCWFCEVPMDVVTAIRPESAPKEGDIGVCIQCEHVSLLDKDGVPRKPDLGELLETIIVGGSTGQFNAYISLLLTRTMDHLVLEYKAEKEKKSA